MMSEKQNSGPSESILYFNPLCSQKGLLEAWYILPYDSLTLIFFLFFAVISMMSEEETLAPGKSVLYFKSLYSQSL